MKIPDEFIEKVANKYVELVNNKEIMKNVFYEFLLINYKTYLNMQNKNIKII